MLPPGFKEEAEERAAAYRSELKLRGDERLDPLRLAAFLEIPVVSLGELRDRWGADPQAVALFLGPARGVFSAATVTDPPYRMVVYNEAQSPRRLANSLAHELAHIILEHEPAPTQSDGLRYWNQDVEQEADWLASVLLVPREGLHRLLEAGYDEPRVAEHFGVSDELVRWRINQSGVRRELELARALARADRA